MLLYGKMEEEMENEEWRKTEYEKYEVNNLGNARSFYRGKFRQVNGTICSDGYKRIDFRINGKKIRIRLHILVAKAFLGERPEGLVIDHIDRNKLNNNINNLRYVTQQENMINTSLYRSDILETDPVKRKKILQNELDIKTGHNQQINRKKGTGCVSKSQNGYRAEIMINKIKYSKRCKTIEECEKYLKEIIESQKI